MNTHRSFFDFAYDADTGVSASTELSAIQQAENLINRMEHGATVFTDDERNLIVNYNYKLDDMEKTRELAEKLAYMIENQPVNEALTVIDAQAEIDALPDGMIGLSEMHEYGYSWNEMLPLTKDKATELFGEDVAVYQLHEDGSETLIEDSEELKEHEGIFGVEKDDWSAYLEHKSMKQELEESPANRVEQLLFGSEDRFGIYQLKDTEEARDIHFMGMDYLESKGIAVTKENYDLLYTAPLEEGTSLEDIYTRFNIDRPADFRGHSLSVSDVVVLHQNGGEHKPLCGFLRLQGSAGVYKGAYGRAYKKNRLRSLMKRRRSFRRLHRNTHRMNWTGKMKCSSSITTNGVRSVRLTWNRITLPLTIRMRMGISDFCICRTRSRTSRLQECITIPMRKLRLLYMKQSGKWRICLSTRKITLVSTW